MIPLKLGQVSLPSTKPTESGSALAPLAAAAAPCARAIPSKAGEQGHGADAASRSRRRIRSGPPAARRASASPMAVMGPISLPEDSLWRSRALMWGSREAASPGS